MKTLKLMIFTYKQLPDTNCNLRKLLAQVDHNVKNYFHRREKPLSEKNVLLSMLDLDILPLDLSQYIMLRFQIIIKHNIASFA